jgi:hypothetical protein
MPVTDADRESCVYKLGVAEQEVKQLRQTLAAVMRQAEADLASANAEICKLVGLDPATHSWPEWSPQANSLRWFSELRGRFNLTDRPAVCHSCRNPLTARGAFPSIETG